jgi:two-component system, LytTR family, response regulator
MTIRALVVDDEAVARRRIRRLLGSEADITVIGECADGASAVRAIATARPHIIFLDVQMPELDGFEVVQALKPRELPAIVFVTAYDRYALRAFDVHAIDYLLKPYTRERFRLAVSRARERLDRGGADAGLAALIDELRSRQRYLARLAVPVGSRTALVDCAEIDWLEAADNYVKLHVDRREYLLRETLGTLEQRLDPADFARIHRSAIVRLDRIAALRPATHGDVHVELRGGGRLTLSRTFRDRVESRLSFLRK